jgi:dUTP pyrophosphatase
MSDASFGYLLKPGARAPHQSHHGDAGHDLFLYMPNGGLVLRPGTTAKVPTGVSLQMSPGWMVDVRGRSGNESKGLFSVRLGTIDWGYTGEINIIIHVPVRLWSSVVNTQDVHLKHGDKIAQLVFHRCENVSLFELDGDLHETERGSNGFGSTDEKPDNWPGLRDE